MDGHYIQIMKKGFICYYGESKDAIGITISNKDGDILYHASFKDPLSREEVISYLDSYISIR